MMMSVVMIAALLASPMAVMADDNGGSGSEQEVVYVNSDGQGINSKITADGFVYSEVESDAYQGIEVYGYKGDATVLKVPEKINGVDVVSFAIDPRWPVWDEVYDQVESIELPKTIVTAHSRYMNYFKGLKAISIPDGNKFYRSKDGVLYKIIDEFGYSRVSAYPRAKEDKSFVMPEFMNRLYRFYKGCPVESVTINALFSGASSNTFNRLEKLKEIKVDESNIDLYAKDGVLFQKIEEGDDGPTTYTHRLLLYPWGKEDAEYTVPSDVNEIRYNSMARNPYLKKVVIPESVDYIDDDAFCFDENLTTVEFKAAQAPDIEDFYRFYGMRDLMYEHEGNVEIKYPAGAKGYEDFIDWMKGKKFNIWELGPVQIEALVYLGSNKEPVWGEPMYGSAYTVYSETKDGEYSKDKPTKTGTWYAKLVVDAGVEDGDSYNGLETEPFEFYVLEVEDKPAENYWIESPDDIDVDLGEEIAVRGTPLFGKIDKVLFRSWDDRENEDAWTDETPEEPGEYDYKAIVDGTEKYEGIVYIASEDYCRITIWLPERDIYLFCDDIYVGEKPAPRAEFYEDEQYDDMDLSKITFKYYQYQKVYVPEDDDGDDYWKLVEVEPKEPGSYIVVGSYDSKDFTLGCSTYFNIFTKVEMAESRIYRLGNPKRLDEYDEEYVEKARAAFDLLTPAEKEELKNLGEENGLDYEKRLTQAEARVATDKAQNNLLAARENYDTAETKYNNAKAKADASKAAADLAAATPGDAAVAAAKKAKEDADALEQAAADLKSAAEAVTAAAEDLADKAKNDPKKTRRDWQDDGRYVKVTEQIADDAKTMESDAKNAAQDAQNAVDSETRKAEKAKEDGEKKAAVEAYNNKVKAAGNLKVSKFKVKAKKKRKAVVTWKVNKKATGYTIQYSLKKNMKKAKTITIKKASIKKATLKKLKKGKKYYVRIRTYTAIKNPATGKVTIKYGKWTSAKKFKAKK